MFWVLNKPNVTRTRDNTIMDISIVVPLYNEEENVELLYSRIAEVVDQHHCDYEIVFVDDGSSDATFSIAKKIAADNPALKVLRFRRNFGQTPAMAAGIEHSSGSTIITMDGDLQNDPRDIPLFLEKIDEGYDIVVGWRHNRQDKLITRKIPSRVANWLIGKVTQVPIKDNGCSLKAYRADVIKNIPLYSEMHRFIPAMSSLAGVRIFELKVRHHARQHGTSKYGLSRVYKVALDLVGIRGILSIMRSPMLFFAKPAALLFLISTLFLYGSLESGSFIFGSIALLSIVSSLILLSWGLVSELVVGTGDRRRTELAKLTLKMDDD